MMRNTLIWLFTSLTLIITQAPAASAADAPYDLLFRNGTLDNIDRDQRLSYTRDVTNTIEPESATRDTGHIELAFGTGEPLSANLKFTQGEKYRNLGSFPASVGNPIIMYFVETVVRDMAESAGGSPFYIRNRVKDALVQPAEVSTGEALFDGQTIETQVVTLRPFKNDPNSDRMKGFDDLALTVTMSDAVPGWYHSLVAHVPDPDSDGAIYSSALTFDTVGGAE